jgi:hypothetical protein
MARADTPVGIDRVRHQDLTGRRHHVWQRRAALVVIAVIPLLGLLNVFGQRTVSSSAQSPAAPMLINSPAHVRGGLVFTTEIVIERAHSASGPDGPAPGLTSCARPPCPPWRPPSSSVQ